MPTPPNTLRAARQRLGLSQAQVGSRVGRHFGTVGRWESGTVTPRPVERRLLAELFAKGEDELFPAAEPTIVSIARHIVGARTLPDLKTAVEKLRCELASMDAA